MSCLFIVERFRKVYLSFPSQTFQLALLSPQIVPNLCGVCIQNLSLEGKIFLKPQGGCFVNLTESTPYRRTQVVKLDLGHAPLPNGSRVEVR